VYQECFQHLLEEFTTYKPLLEAVKHEYELWGGAGHSAMLQLDSARAQIQTFEQAKHRELTLMRAAHEAESKAVANKAGPNLAESASRAK
jgi:hypothetical protein